MEQQSRWFAGNVLLLAGASGLGQLLAFLAAPLITRLYAPEALGQFAFFNAAIGIVYPIASLRYEWAILVAPDEDTALDLLALATSLLIAASLVLFGILIFGISTPIAAWTGMGVSELVLFPLSLATFSFNGIATIWLTRVRAFSEIAAIRLTTPLAVIVAQVALGSLGFGILGLIIGSSFGYLLALFIRASTFHQALARGVRQLRLTRLRRVAAEYRIFAMISAPSNLINGLGAQLPNLAFPWLYGVAVTGQYSLARRILVQSGDLVSRAVNQVYVSESARLFADNPGRLLGMFTRLALVILLILMPSVILIWYGPAIFSLLFGPAWSQAGSFAAVLVLANCLENIAHGTSGLITFGLNRWMGAWEITRLTLVASAFFAAWQMKLTPIGCAIALSAATFAASAVLFGLNGAALLRADRRNRSAMRIGASSVTAEKRL
jgi:O-antigen/teichoic acid export membrane protein